MTKKNTTKKTKRISLALSEEEIEGMFKKQVNWIEKTAAFFGLLLAYALTITAVAVLIKLFIMLWSWIL